MALASSVDARGRTSVCNRSASHVTVKRDLTVPAGGVCRLVDAKVRGDITVRQGGYLQIRDTIVRGDVRGSNAKTIFLDDDSVVKGNVKSSGAVRVFLFNGTVNGRVAINRARLRANVCGMKVGKGIQVRKSGLDILVGDPLADGCPGNRVKSGDIEVEDNVTDVELVVRGNRIAKGDLSVNRNAGPSQKFVEDNTGNKLECNGNGNPFAASNTGWKKMTGQCAAP
jgi:hypothetical protein